MTALSLRCSIRRLLALAALGAALAAAAPDLARAQSAPPVLRDQVVVHGDLVTLGDIFENAGAAAKVAVFRAPDLGTQGVVAAARVAEAAERHGLAWNNPHSVPRITVSRPSRLVGHEEIAALLRNRIAAELGVTDPKALDVDLPRNLRPMHIDPQVTEPLVVKRLSLDPRSGSFHAVVGLQESNSDTPDQAYQGRATEMVEVAAPMRGIERGAVMADGDVTTMRIPRLQLSSDVIVDRAGLIGMAARRGLPPDRPVRRADIERPKLVERNAIVSIVYRVRGLVLRSSGRALGDGALGESVPVLNIQSKRTIYAQVAGPGEVSVSSERPEITPPASNHANTAPGGRYLVR